MIGDRFRALLTRLLEVVVILLMVALTAVVVLAVIYRKLGDSFSWYDEIASILLAWLTYYGAALAALKRAHIGVDRVVLSLPPSLRMTAVLFAELCVLAFFALLAWTGWQVLVVLEGMRLISLTWIPVQLTQSVIPIGGALFLLCQLVSFPGYWRRMRDGLSAEDVELAEHAAQEAGPGPVVDADAGGGAKGGRP